MCLENHLQELRRKHQELDDKIDRLSKPPFGTYADLRPAKRERLKLKEAIVAAEAALKRQQEAREQRSNSRPSATITPLPLPAEMPEAFRPAA